MITNSQNTFPTSKLLDNFGRISLRRLITFFGDLFSANTGGRRLKERHQVRSPAMIRGALMRAVRQPDSFHSHVRALQVSSEPLMVLELNEFISLSFDFNFGDGLKDLLFGVQFHYDSGDSLTES